VELELQSLFVVQAGAQNIFASSASRTQRSVLEGQLAESPALHSSPEVVPVVPVVPELPLLLEALVWWSPVVPKPELLFPEFVNPPLEEVESLVTPVV
jgi:hypothetical protein